MATKPTAKSAPKANPTTNLNQQMSALQKQIQTTSTSIAQSLAAQNTASQAAAAKAQADLETANAQNTALQTQLANVQLQYSQLQSQQSTTSQQTRQNVFDTAINQMKNWGLLKTDANGNLDSASQALSDQIKNLAFADAGADTVSLALQNSDAYKARFAGNETRKAAGLPVLSPAEYIATETKYDQILRNAGVPKGFYSGTNEMAKLIGADVSPTELQGRVDLAAKSILNADPYYTDTLKNYYGLSSGDMIAHVLDPSAALPLIQQQVSSATIGAEAARQATNINENYAKQLASLGVTQTQASQGFQSIAQQQAQTQALASRYNAYAPSGDVGQLLQAATFGSTTQTTGETAAQAEQKLKRLQVQEVSQFGGSAGADTRAQSLGVANEQGVY